VETVILTSNESLVSHPIFICEGRNSREKMTQTLRNDDITNQLRKKGSDKQIKWQHIWRKAVKDAVLNILSSDSSGLYGTFVWDNVDNSPYAQWRHKAWCARGMLVLVVINRENFDSGHFECLIFPGDDYQNQHSSRASSLVTSLCIRSIDLFLTVCLPFWTQLLISTLLCPMQ
jgi:hypothetical protein